ncbi:hypothetical protein BC832DRAFT_591231 [Gaertneriomyces semiglobifer]|nr:hypothetical protein BC832DRAFT_591231 [Gaertneriomyces semiglobifer]
MITHRNTSVGYYHNRLDFQKFIIAKQDLEQNASAATSKAENTSSNTTTLARENPALASACERQRLSGTADTEKRTMRNVTYIEPFFGILLIGGLVVVSVPLVDAFASYAPGLKRKSHELESEDDGTAVEDNDVARPVSRTGHHDRPLTEEQRESSPGCNSRM